MPQPDLFAHLDRYNEVVAMFDGESDRAAAILSAIYIDTLLEKLLKTKFVQSPKEDMFSSNGPLGTFSSRIDLAFALGLFDKNVYHDLGLIRRIRNDFAHDIDRGTFHTEAIRQRCGQFWFTTWLSDQKLNHALNSRGQFICAVANGVLSMTAPFHQEWLGKPS